MDVFKLDLDQAQIGTSLVESSTTNNTIQRSLHAATGSTGANNTINKNDTIHGVDDDEDDDDEVLPEVSFDANSDFNLHFFDTPEDSSTQGGFSDAGSLESETEAFLETPLLTSSGSGLGHQQQPQQQHQTSASLNSNCQKYYQSSSGNHLNPREACLSNTNSQKNINTALSAASSTSFTQFGNGGGALYATNNNSNNSVHNFGQSNSSSSGCSSTSSIASNSSSICGSSSSHTLGSNNTNNTNNTTSSNNNSSDSKNNRNHLGSISGNKRIICSTTISCSTGSSQSSNTTAAATASAVSSSATASGSASSLSSEHFIGNLNHTSTQSSTVSSTIASLASVKLPKGRIETKLHKSPEK